MAQDDILPHMSRDHGPWVIDDGNHGMVSNHNKMISTTALVTRQAIA
jgi:hypothetical protein